MSISPEILAKQQEYAALPFMARIHSANFSASFRFNTLDEAIQYLRSQCKRHGRVTTSLGGFGGHGVCPRDTYVVLPTGKALTLEDLNIAVEPQGPGVPLWIIL